MLAYALVAVLAYLLGSIPFGYLLVRFFRREDIRTRGSGNIGATNVMRTGARGLGLVTLALDAAKGALAVVLARLVVAQAHGAVHGSEKAAALAALLAMVGHVFPVWLGFRGGKGVATGLGVFLALAPLSAVCALGVFLLIVALSRYVSLASITAAACFPLFVWLLLRPSDPPLLVTCAVLASALIILKHHQNIRRLLAGTEHRFGARRA